MCSHGINWVDHAGLCSAPLGIYITMSTDYAITISSMYHCVLSFVVTTKVSDLWYKVSPFIKVHYFQVQFLWWVKFFYSTSIWFFFFRWVILKRGPWQRTCGWVSLGSFADRSLCTILIFRNVYILLINILYILQSTQYGSMRLYLLMCPLIILTEYQR